MIGPLPADPRLPALGSLLGDDGVPDAVLELADAQDGGVEYVRYRPGKSCVVLWSAGGALVSGKLFDTDDGARIVERPSFRRLAARTRAPYRWVPDARLLLQVFPLDVRLPGLPDALAGRRLGRPAVHSYKPWRRCVLRFEDEDGRTRHVGKIFRDGRGAAMPTRLTALRAQLDGAWSVQPPVAYDAGANLLVFEGVDGELGGRLLRQAALGEAAARAAAGLAALHRARVDGLPVVQARAILHRLRDTLPDLRGVAPQTARAVEARLRSLEEEAGRLPREALGPAHGAFRHDQLLLRGDELVVVDFDGLSLAGAGADPGNFLAYLDVVAVRRPRLEAAAREAQAAFVAGLGEHPALDPRWLDWHRSAARVKWALRSVFALAPDWPERVRALLGNEAR